jgi:hypothetical protein
MMQNRYAWGLADLVLIGNHFLVTNAMNGKMDNAR